MLITRNTTRKATQIMATKSKAKVVTFATVRQAYAKRKGINVTKASKQLRAKIRGQYGKDKIVTKYLDRANKDNRDGNRYPDMTPAEAKHIVSL